MALWTVAFHEHFMGEKCNLLIFVYDLIYLCIIFLAGLSLCCCTQAFSSCSARAWRRSGFSSVEHGLQGAQAQQLTYTGLVAPWHVGTSQTRDRTHVPCIGRRILYHWTTRETQRNLFKGKCMPLYFLLNVHIRLHICAFSCVVGGSERESRSVVANSLWPHGLSSPWNSPGQNTGVGRLSLLQGIFWTQELNQGLLHCRWILYHLSYQGSP